MAKQPERTTREAISHFFNSLYQIGRIAYDSAPFISLSILLIRFVQAAIVVASAYVMKLIFDSLGIVLGGSDFLFERDILPWIILFGVLNIINNSLTALHNYWNEELGRKLRLHTSILVYQHLLSLQGMESFESSHFHDKLEQATRHLQMLPPRLIGQLSSVLVSLLTLFGFLGILLAYNPLLVVVLVIATLPTVFANLKFRQMRFDIERDNTTRGRKAWYYGALLSQTQYAKEVRLFNLGSYILNKYISVMEAIQNPQREMDRAQLRSNTALSILGASVSVGMYIYIIAQAFARQITLGDVSLFIEAVRTVQTNLTSLSAAIVDLSERTLFFTVYQDLLAIHSSLELYEPAQAPPPLQEKIELRGVSFRYAPESDYVLKDVDLTLHKGESLALVGLNGAGKTTLVKLLARFYDPTEGQILWDGIDIRHFKPESLRQRLGAVLQDFTRYDLSARENIGLGDLHYIDDMPRIQSAAQQVGVDRFISSLPDGYNTILSRWLVEQDNKGTDLSGGQWQKIAISRAYLRNADVLMLDEPTAALDAEAEHDIYERFAELSRNRATILISHRFSTVRMAQKIAVIEDGRITEYGTHAELMEQKGAYAHLYSLQAEQYT